MIRHRIVPSVSLRSITCRWALTWLAASLLSSTLLFADEAGTPSASPASAPVQVETIVCIRHGEKPKAGLGNLDAEGRNRALALPDVL